MSMNRNIAPDGARNLLAELRHVELPRFKNHMEELEYLKQHKIRFVRESWTDFKKCYSWCEIVYFYGEPTKMGSMANVRVFLAEMTVNGLLDGNMRMYKVQSVSLRRISLSAKKLFENDEIQCIFDEASHAGLKAYYEFNKPKSPLQMLID